MKDIVGSLFLSLLLVGLGLIQLVALESMQGYNAPIIGAVCLLFQIPMLGAAGKRSERGYAGAALIIAQLILFATSYAYSERTAYGLWKVQGFVLFTVMPVFLLVANYQGGPARLFQLLVWMAILACSPLLVLVSNGADSPAEIKWWLIQNGYDVIAMGRTLGAGAILWLVYGLVIGKRWWCIVCSIVLLYAMFRINERGPVLASLAGLTQLVLYAGLLRGRRFQMAKMRFRGLLLACLFAIIGGIGIFVAMPRFSFQEMLVDGRIFILSRSWELFNEHPLFGAGLGSFAEMSYMRSGREYAHNLFIEILAETGLVGLAISTVYFVWVGLSWRKTSSVVLSTLDVKSRFCLIAAKTLFIYYLVASQVSGDLVTNALVWVTGAMVALAPVQSADGVSSRPRMAVQIWRRNGMGSP